MTKGGKTMLTARKMADVSTCHITRDDCLILEANAEAGSDPCFQNSIPAFPLRVSKYEYGFYVSVPSLEDSQQAGTLDDLRKDLLAAGMSEAFITLIHQAMKERFFAVNLDKDGEECEELVKFNW